MRDGLISPFIQRVKTAAAHPELSGRPDQAQQTERHPNQRQRRVEQQQQRRRRKFPHEQGAGERKVPYRHLHRQVPEVGRRQERMARPQQEDVADAGERAEQAVTPKPRLTQSPAVPPRKKKCTSSAAIAATAMGMPALSVVRSGGRTARRQRIPARHGPPPPPATARG